jgi:hypothetical protein
MSHDRSWRAACLITITTPCLHFEIHFHSTRRDSCGRWLWRLVRRFGERREIRHHFGKQCTSQPLPGDRMPSSIGEQLLPFVGSACRTRSWRCHLPLPHSRRTFEQRRDRIYADPRPDPLRPRTRAPSSRVARHSSASTRRPPHRQSSVIDHTYQLSLSPSARRTTPIKMPNVKDEPRPQLARRVPQYDYKSIASFRSPLR